MTGSQDAGATRRDRGAHLQTAGARIETVAVHSDADDECPRREATPPWPSGNRPPRPTSTSTCSRAASGRGRGDPSGYGSCPRTRVRRAVLERSLWVGPAPSPSSRWDPSRGKKPWERRRHRASGTWSGTDTDPTIPYGQGLCGGAAAGCACASAADLPSEVAAHRRRRHQRREGRLRRGVSRHAGTSGQVVGTADRGAGVGSATVDPARTRGARRLQPRADRGGPSSCTR